MYNDDVRYSLNCIDIGYILGKFPSQLLNFDAPSSVFYENVDTYSFNTSKKNAPEWLYLFNIFIR